jgi:hypothetical protein
MTEISRAANIRNRKEKKEELKLNKENKNEGGETRRDIA